MSIIEKKMMRPVLDGDFWLIGANPDLGELNGLDPATGARTQQCVDHHVYQDLFGYWHLWGCIRMTKVGRILYHWETREITSSCWQPTGQILRADPHFGESINDWWGDEWIQSPYIVKEDGRFYMFYGGHASEVDVLGLPVQYDPDERQEITCAKSGCQICLMVSDTGREWVRYKDLRGYSRLFVGPGEARDPDLIKIDGVWHLYYAGAHVDDSGKPACAIYLRTSTDLIHWSDFTVVHYDHRPEVGNGGMWTHECPHVVKRGGYYYLFRTENYAGRLTHVYRSEDPKDFGKGPAAVETYVCRFPVAAPEIIVDSLGNEYITSNHDLRAGTMMSRLKWEEE